MSKLEVVWMVVLLALLNLTVLAHCQTLPAAGSGNYLIEPGEYNMTADVSVDVNATALIAGNCSGTGETVCVTINLDGFGFQLSSVPDTPSITIQGIRFTSSSPSNTTAAINLASRIYNITLLDVTLEESSAPLLRGISPENANFSRITLSNNNISRAIDLFSTTSPFLIMSQLTMTNSIATNNGLSFDTSNTSTGASSSWDTPSLIFLSVQSIDLISISDSQFSNNPSIVNIGYSPTSLISDGAFLIKVERCNFTNHQPHATSMVDGAMVLSSTVQAESALIIQTTTSFGPTPWIFNKNTFTSNNVTIIKVNDLPSLSFTQNQVVSHNQRNVFEGQISSFASFVSNVYRLGSGMMSIESDPSLAASVSTNVTMTNEWVDFGGESLLAISSTSEALSGYGDSSNIWSIYGFDKVILKNVTFLNISPANISTQVHPAVVYMEKVTAATLDSCSFQNVSLTTSGLAHAGRITVGFTQISSTTTTLTLKSNTFGSYDQNDTTTADVVAQSRSGTSGTLNLVNSPSTATLNLSRIASTVTNLVVQSPLVVTQSLYNLVDFSFSSVSVSRLILHDPLLVYGRIALAITSRADFFWTPTRNGTLLMAPVPTFVPKLTVTNAIFAVDLGDGLIVPSNSLYTLVSPCRAAALPTQAVLESWSGRTNKPGFTGVLVQTSVGTDPLSSEATFAISMRATPTCSVACVVGKCDKREDCTCDPGWSGTACTCLNNGKPAGVQCSNSTTSFEWIATTPQIISPTTTFSIPDSLTYYVNNDMSISGTLVMTSSSRLVVSGTLSLSGTLTIQSTATSYPYSCDIYMPNMIACDAIATTSGFVANVHFDASQIATTCQNARRENQDNKERRSNFKRSTGDNFFDEHYDSLIAVNGSTQMSGSINVDASSVDVTPGRQQQLGVVTSTGILTQTDTLSVTGTTKGGICSTTDSKPTLISLTLTACNGVKTKTQWWWYGAPVIGVVFVFILIAIIVISVPSYRVAVFPYSAKME